MWQDGADCISGYSAHLIVTILSEGMSGNDVAMKKGILFVKILSCLCQSPNTLGIMSSGVVFQPKLYQDLADLISHGEFPISNLVWFGLYEKDGKTCGYTHGLYLFNKDEMEIIGSELGHSELRYFLMDIASYVVENDITFKDGETVGLSEDDIHTITKSDGIAHNSPTLKISG